MQQTSNSINEPVTVMFKAKYKHRIN